MTKPFPNKTLSPWILGASLYMPAHQADLTLIANGEKLKGLRSMIFCTEDAIADDDIPESLRYLGSCLKSFHHLDNKHRFIRVRNPEILARLLDLNDIHKIDGFVLPKFNETNFRAYFEQLQGTHFKLMPTLETKDVFDISAMSALRDELIRADNSPPILMLRIGGNDLMNLLGIRRPRGFTLYQTPMANVIANLVTLFKPFGFSLSAPVFEYLNDHLTLQQEISYDLAYGLTGKTAIHPNQISTIEACYAVDPKDYEMALTISCSTSPAVFKMHDAMCEVATHQQWAQNIINRKQTFGIKDMLSDQQNVKIYV